MNGRLKKECHGYVDELSATKEEKRAVYRWLGRKMHIKGLHFKNLSTEQLLHARRLLKELIRKRGSKR